MRLLAFLSAIAILSPAFAQAPANDRMRVESFSVDVNAGRLRWLTSEGHINAAGDYEPSAANAVKCEMDLESGDIQCGKKEGELGDAGRLHFLQDLFAVGGHLVEMTMWPEQQKANQSRPHRNGEAPDSNGAEARLRIRD